MIFSIFSLALCVWILIAPLEAMVTTTLLPYLAVMMVTVGTAILILVPLISTLFTIPFQRTEQNLTPRLLESITHDKPLAWGNILLLFFPFLSYLCVIALLLFDMGHKVSLIAAWVLFLGISLDLLRAIIKRSISYMDPSKVVERFVLNAKESIRTNRDADTWQWMDALSDMAMKAIEKHSFTLLTQSLNALLRIFQIFLESCKSISHPSQDTATESATGRDEVSYTVFSVTNRLEMIYNKALDRHLEPFCSQALALLGKMTLSAAKLDLSLGTFPIQILGKLSTRAQEHHLEDVAIKASGILIEIAKSILSSIDVTYREIKDLFIAITNSLDNIAKMTFRKDKTISIPIIVEPLQTFLLLMQSEKLTNHPDTPLIIANIKRVLDEFMTLEQVLRTMPPIPTMQPTQKKE
jgi:hypothetical protein